MCRRSEEVVPTVGLPTHFVVLFTRDNPFYTVIRTHRPIESPFTTRKGYIRRTYSRLKPPASPYRANNWLSENVQNTNGAKGKHWNRNYIYLLHVLQHSTVHYSLKCIGNKLQLNPFSAGISSVRLNLHDPVQKVCCLQCCTLTLAYIMYIIAVYANINHSALNIESQRPSAIPISRKLG